MVATNNGKHAQVNVSDDENTIEIVAEKPKDNDGWFSWFWKPQKQEEQRPQKQRRSLSDFGSNEDLDELEINDAEYEDESSVYEKIDLLKETTDYLARIATNLSGATDLNVMRSVQYEKINLLSSQITNLIGKIKEVDEQITQTRQQLAAASSELAKLKKSLSAAKGAAKKQAKNAEEKLSGMLSAFKQVSDLVQAHEDNLIRLSQTRTDLVVEQEIIIRLLEKKREELDQMK